MNKRLISGALLLLTLLIFSSVKADVIVKLYLDNSQNLLELPYGTNVTKTARVELVRDPVSLSVEGTIYFRIVNSSGTALTGSSQISVNSNSFNGSTAIVSTSLQLSSSNINNHEGKIYAELITTGNVVYKSNEIQLTTAISNNNICCDQTIPLNSQPSLLTGSAPVGGNSSGYTYQWQQSDDNITWVNIGTANNSNYQPPTLSASKYYRRLVNSTNATTSSSPSIKITPQENLEIEIVMLQKYTDGTVIANTYAEFKVKTPISGVTYNWTYGVFTPPYYWDTQSQLNNSINFPIQQIRGGVNGIGTIVVTSSSGARAEFRFKAQ